jgi:NADPH:quinone reductase-like Zn-dependent oxidoreductase
MPHILGNDIVGVALEVGEGVRHVKPGDRVLVCPTLSCGYCAQCQAGDDNLCRQYDVIGRRRNGGYAERVVVPGVNCLPYPERLSWTEAAAVPLVFLTAWHMLVGRARIKAGEDCLVIAGGSGVGSAAVQIARLHGARVIATAGTDAKLERLRGLGVHDVVNHADEDFAARVRDLTDGKGVEGRVRTRRRRGVRARRLDPGAQRPLVTCGATIGGKAALDLNLLFGRHLALFGSWMGRRAELVEVLQFIADGRLQPVVDSVMPLAEARQAHERIEARQHFGKVVLTP